METVFHTSVVILAVLYTILLMAYARIFARGPEGVARFVQSILVITVCAHFASLLIRGNMVKACPLSSAAEFLSLVAFSIAIIYAVLEVRIGERTTGVFAITPAFLLQMVATVRILGTEGLPESRIGLLRSFHNLSATIAFSAVAICGVYGILYLFLYGAIKSGRFGLFYKKMPPLEKLAQMSYVAAWIAFLGLAFTVGMDSWIHVKGGTPEALLRAGFVLKTLLCLLYGGSIVARRFFGLGGRRLAYATVLGACVLVATIIIGELQVAGFPG
jgi:ABC-type uncharacterized transport system permease subunit